MIKERIYAATDVDIKFTIDSGLTLSDIVDMQAVFQKDGFSKTFTLSGGDIAKVSTYLVLSIPKTQITDPGLYDVKLTYTDSNSKIRTLSASKYSLIFN